MCKRYKWRVGKSYKKTFRYWEAYIIKMLYYYLLVAISRSLLRDLELTGFH